MSLLPLPVMQLSLADYDAFFFICGCSRMKRLKTGVSFCSQCCVFLFYFEFEKMISDMPCIAFLFFFSFCFLGFRRTVFFLCYSRFFVRCYKFI